MCELILGIDVGTTSLKSAVYTLEGSNLLLKPLNTASSHRERAMSKPHAISTWNRSKVA
jgi:sugar (pentulose or hexulose) kinase